MDEVVVKLQQLLQHLKMVNNKKLFPLARKVCLCYMQYAVLVLSLQEEWKSLYEEFVMSNSETNKVSQTVVVLT